MRLIPAGTLLVNCSTAEETLHMECRLPCVCCWPIASFLQHGINGLMLMTGAALMMLRVTLSTHSEEQW